MKEAAKETVYRISIAIWVSVVRADNPNFNQVIWPLQRVREKAAGPHRGANLKRPTKVRRLPALTRRGDGT